MWGLRDSDNLAIYSKKVAEVLLTVVICEDYVIAIAFDWNDDSSNKDRYFFFNNKIGGCKIDKPNQEEFLRFDNPNREPLRLNLAEELEALAKNHPKFKGSLRACLTKLKKPPKEKQECVVIPFPARRNR